MLDLESMLPGQELSAVRKYLRKAHIITRSQFADFDPFVLCFEPGMNDEMIDRVVKAREEFLADYRSDEERDASLMDVITIDQLFENIQGYLVLKDYATSHQIDKVWQLSEDDFLTPELHDQLGTKSYTLLFDRYKEFLSINSLYEKRGVVDLSLIPSRYAFLGTEKGYQFVQSLRFRFPTVLSFSHYDFTSKVRGLSERQMRELTFSYLDFLVRTPFDTTSVFDEAVSRDTFASYVASLHSRFAFAFDSSSFILAKQKIVEAHKKGRVSASFALGQHFLADFAALHYKARKIYALKVSGKSYTEIAQIYSLSIEGIRRQFLKAVEQLEPSADELAQTLLRGRDKFGFDEIEDCFADKSKAKLCLYQLTMQSKIVQPALFCSQFMNSKLHAITNEEELMNQLFPFINKGLIFDSDTIERLNTWLINHHLEYYTPGDIKLLLIKNGYKAWNALIAKPKFAFSILVSYVVKKYYPTGFSLEDPATIAQLTKIMETTYGMHLDSLGSIKRKILRCECFIPVRNGFYQHGDTIKIEKSLLEHIVQRIQTSLVPVQTVTLFHEFQSELCAHSDITTVKGLNGLLRYFYPHFTYRSGNIANSHQQIDTLLHRMEAYIMRKGSVSEEEMVAHFGFEATIISLRLRHSQMVIKVPSGYCSLSFFSLGNEEINQLVIAVEDILTAYKGYCTLVPLHRELMKKDLPFLGKREKDNEATLFALLSKVLAPYFIFSSGINIALKSFPVKPLTQKAVASYFLSTTTRITYEERDELAKRYHWTIGIHQQPLILEDNPMFFRIDSHTFIRRDHVNIPLHKRRDVVETIRELLTHHGGILVSTDIDLSNFPVVGYPWNTYLLFSLLKEEAGSKLDLFPLKRSEYVIKDGLWTKTAQIDTVITLVKRKTDQTLLPGQRVAQLGFVLDAELYEHVIEILMKERTMNDEQ